MALKGIVRGTDYIFSAANKTITFSNDYAGMSLSDITYITNIKNGVATVIYDPFDATKGGELDGLTLLLSFDTTTMADSDPLQIIVGFTPINQEPSPVKIVPQSNDIDQTQLLQSMADDLDLISLAMDDREKTPLNVKETGIKKDAQGAIIVSDAATPIPIALVRTNDQIVIDTAGYSSLSVQLISTGGVISYQIQGTNDFNISTSPSSWVAIPATYLQNNANSAPTLGGYGLSTGTLHTHQVSCITRFVRIIITSAGTGVLTGTAYLRTAPGVLGGTTSIPVNANIATIGGNATLGLSTPDSNPLSPSSVQPTLGTGSISGASNAPNAASTISSFVPYPIGIGARENPYMGKFSGVYRYVTVDGGGKFVLGGDTPTTATPYQSTKADGSVPGLSPRGVGGIPNNMVGAQNLTITDASQVEGDTNTMLLKQILQELKILNQQLIEVPFLLNNGESTMSDPQEYRNDNSNLF